MDAPLGLQGPVRTAVPLHYRTICACVVLIERYAQEVSYQQVAHIFCKVILPDLYRLKRRGWFALSPESKLLKSSQVAAV
jgi:hypothetical protein